MKDNLNCLKYGYLPWSYIPNWFKNIRQFFRNLKYAYQRITQGYCEQDLWNLDVYYSELFYNTLRDLATTTMGYPGTGEFSDENGGFEAWQRYLNEMAEHFLNTQEWNEELPVNIEVQEAFDKMTSYISETIEEPTEDGYFRMIDHYTDEVAYERARKKWLAKEKAAWKFRESEKNKAFDMMKKYFFSLWD